MGVFLEPLWPTSFIKKALKSIFYDSICIKMNIQVNILEVNIFFNLKVHFFLLISKEMETFYGVLKVLWSPGTVYAVSHGYLSPACLNILLVSTM